MCRKSLFYLLVFLLQKSDARTEKCTEKDPAYELPRGVACAFNWFDIVQNQNHPCSDNNYYGFKNQEPCVLVKVNKVGLMNTKFLFASIIERKQF